MSKQTVNCEIVRKTEKALLIRTKRGVECWVPVSQISRKLTIPGEKFIEIDVPAWLANEKGIDQ